MISRILTFTVIGFIAGAIFIGCQNLGEKKLQAATETNEEIKTESKAEQTSYSEDWEKFKKESEEKIQINENRIAIFKEKMKKNGAKIKAAYNKEISNLEETNKEMKKTLNNYKNDGKNVWEDFKTGFNNAMDKLGKAVNDLTADSDK